jgi:uncharacterized delta-60 repeat protein
MMKASSLALAGLGAGWIVGAILFACGTDNGNGGSGCTGDTCDGGPSQDAITGQADGGALEATATDGAKPVDGGAGDAGVVCTGPAGTLDPTFGDGGVVLLTYPSSSANSVVVQPDGKIVVGGYTAQSLALVRLLPSGSPDSTFGTAGLVQVPLGDFGAIVSALALQADGKIVAAGSAHIPGSPAGDRGDFALIRLLTNGSLDPTFGDAGVVTTNIGGTDQALGIALLADGHVLAGGNTGKVTDYALVRYNADGSLDATFGVGGKVTTNVGGFFDYANGMAVLPSGTILLAGGSSEDGGAVSNSHFSAARYSNTGALDNSFADAGYFVAADIGEFSDLAFAVVLEPGGNAVLAGSKGAPADFALVRLSASGVPDGTFGTGGFARTDLGGDEQALSLSRQADGRLLAVGIRAVAGTPSDLVVARYSSIGTLDPTFGTGGVVSKSFSPTYGAGGNASAGSGCHLVVAGTLSDATGLGETAMVILRFGL